MTTPVYLVMKRYTMDNSPLDEAEDYAEQVRFIFADYNQACLMADELEKNYAAPCIDYYVKAHHVVPSAS